MKETQPAVTNDTELLFGSPEQIQRSTMASTVQRNESRLGFKSEPNNAEIRLIRETRHSTKVEQSRGRRRHCNQSDDSSSQDDLIERVASQQIKLSPEKTQIKLSPEKTPFQSTMNAAASVSPQLTRKVHYVHIKLDEGTIEQVKKTKSKRQWTPQQHNRVTMPSPEEELRRME
jgi:hypothetical protein